MVRRPPPVDAVVAVHGHVRSVRQLKNVGFIDISDGTTSQNLNVVVRDPLVVAPFKVGQAIRVKGTWKESQGVQAHEMWFEPDAAGHELAVIGDVPTDYPIQKKLVTLQHLRQLPTLRHRTGTLALVLRLRLHAEHAMAAVFADHGFTKVAPPIVTGLDCEGAGETFEVVPAGFFGTKAYLTVSTQLHLEVLAASLNRVWTLTPCFRAEHSHTNRHLSEFWMVEAEVSYVDSVEQLTTFVEEVIRLTVERLAPHKDDLLRARYKHDDKDVIEERWRMLLTQNWPSITYTEAIDLINRIKLKGRLKGRLAWGDSIQTEHEKWLAAHYNLPVFITHYPAEQKPFYMPMAEGTAGCFDLIVPEIGELVGGSLREHNHDKLVAEMKRRNMNVADMEWYVSTRRNGATPHGGFGMGFERLVAFLTAMDNIKDVIAFPRAPDSCVC